MNLLLYRLFRHPLLSPFTAGRITMEFVRGAVVGGLFGNLVSIVLSLLLVLGYILLSRGGWDGARLYVE